MAEDEEDKEPEEAGSEEQEEQQKEEAGEDTTEEQHEEKTGPQDKTGGGLEIDHKLLAGFGIVALIAAGLFFATNSGNILDPGASGASSEMAFTPEKTFTYDFGEGTVHIYATGENATHLKGIMEAEGPRSGEPLYQRFLINRETLSMKTTRNVRRSQLDSADLQYRQMRGEILSGVFLATAGLNQTQRKNLVQPGESQVRGTKVITTETELDGREAYKLNISNSEATFYISREKPFMTLEVEGGDRSLELTGVEEGVPEAITQAEPLETSGDRQEASCSKSVSGFSTTDVRVADFAASEGQFAVELRNAAADPVTVRQITLEGEGTTTSRTTSREIPVGGAGSFAIQNAVEQTDGCNQIGLTVTYDMGQLEGLEVTGTLQTSLALQ